MHRTALHVTTIVKRDQSKMQQAMRIPGKPHIDTPGLTPEGQLKQYLPCRGYGDWLSMSLNSAVYT